jgi:hypothetical protein
MTARSKVILSRRVTCLKYDAGMACFDDVPGWVVTGPGDTAPDFVLRDYEGGLDRSLTHEGRPVVQLRSTVKFPEQHAMLMQRIVSDRYRGKRVKFGAWVKTEAVEQSAGLWMRATPRDLDRSYAHAHAQAVGTTDWTRLDLACDIPGDASYLLFGLSLHGPGRVWMSGPTFDVVGSASLSVADRPLEPRNLELKGA